MYKTIAFVLLGTTICGTAFAQRNVQFTGGLESGAVRDLASNVDGFRIRTLPHPQVGGEVAIVDTGGAGPDSKIDTRVVPSEIVPTNGNGDGNELVAPRRGNYFARSALYFEKDYSQLQSGENKPRSAIAIAGKDNKVNFDEEGYLGFSIYLPKNWEHETGVVGDRGTSQFLQVQSKSARNTLILLRVYVPKGKSEAHWFFSHKLSDSSVSGGTETEYDLGNVKNDLGKWTDFVLRYRFNPFSRRTNASIVPNGKDQVYGGNKGILQLWKARGSVDQLGNRQMALTSVNLENEPVGLVPHATEKFDWSFRIYKYGWHRNSTNVKGPVWVGFDEIRDGRVQKNGTTYMDVHPAGLACTDRCPGGGVRPLAPELVTSAN